MFTDDRPDSDDCCLADATRTLRPGWRVLSKRWRFQRPPHYRSLLTCFVGVSQEDEARSIPRMWLFSFFWDTQRVVCPNSVVYRVPRTSLFSVTPCRTDRELLLPKQAVHFILFGLHQEQGLEQRQIRPFLPSLNKRGTVYLLEIPKCCILITESLFLKMDPRVRNM
jgi:hypothetical protein